MMNLSKWKKMGVSSTKVGSNTVMFMRTLQIVVMAYFELTISNLEFSIINFGSETSWSTQEAYKIVQLFDYLCIINQLTYIYMYLPVLLTNV
jgi:hypothetical protein